MVQGQAENKTTKATNCITRHIKQSTYSIQPTTTVTSIAEEEEMQQARSNSLAVHSKHHQQPAFPDQRRFQQQKATGFVKDTFGKESSSDPEQNSTYHNRHKMDQM